MVVPGNTRFEELSGSLSSQRNHQYCRRGYPSVIVILLRRLELITVGSPCLPLASYRSGKRGPRVKKLSVKKFRGPFQKERPQAGNPVWDTKALFTESASSSA